MKEVRGRVLEPKEEEFTKSAPQSFKVRVVDRIAVRITHGLNERSKPDASIYTIRTEGRNWSAKLALNASSI